MQKICISVLNPIYYKWIASLDAKIKGLMIAFICVLFHVFFILYHSEAFGNVFYTETQRHLVAFVLLAGIVVFSMNRPLQQVRVNRWIVAPLLLGGAGVVFTGILHPLGSGYLVFGLMLLTVYPCLYLVWTNRGDYEVLFDIVAQTNVAIGLCYAAYSLLIRILLPETVVAGRFCSTCWNANLFSMLGMAMTCCAIYMLYRKRQERTARRYYIIAVIVGFAEVLAGQSRSAILACAAGAFALFVFGVKSGVIKKQAARIALIVMAVLLLAGALIVYLGAQKGQNQEDPTGGIPQVIERFLPSEEGLDGYSSGRITIWKSFADKLNVLGNDYTQREWNYHAHNNFLEFSYRCGVPVGLLFTLLSLIALAIALKRLFSKDDVNDYELFYVIFAMVYFIQSLVDIATIPMERVAPFFFYLALAGMAGYGPGRTAAYGKHAKREMII